MTPADLYSLMVACLLVGLLAGIALTLAYLHSNLHLRSEEEWQRAVIDEEFARWRRAKQAWEEEL